MTSASATDPGQTDCKQRGFSTTLFFHTLFQQAVTVKYSHAVIFKCPKGEKISGSQTVVGLITIGSLAPFNLGPGSGLDLI